MSGYICGIGGANVDFSIRSFAPVILRDSNPGESKISPGGVNRNILENLARMGEECQLITVFGDDLFGTYLQKECAKQGIGTAHALLCPHMATSCYVSMNDDTGDMLVGMSDMRMLQELTPAYLARKLPILQGAKAVVIDLNLPEATLEYLCSGVLQGTPLYADPVSTGKAKKLKGKISSFHCIKPNRMELATLSEQETQTNTQLQSAAAVLLERGCKEVVVSLGAEGCYWADAKENRFFLAQPPLAKVANATGAGDAFLAGLIHGEMLGLEPVSCAKMALSAGRLACMSQYTVAENMSHKALLHTMEEENEPLSGY